MLHPEDEWPVGRPVPRIDSFEVIEGDCVVPLTDEEKTWPVGRPVPRIDSFEVIDMDTEPAPEAVVGVTVEPAAPAADVRVLLDRLRAAVDEARAATGGRLAIRLDLPAPPP
ncbi:MAG: hypothetical protein K2X82_12240 [Gemmataceae bacterium]|nr:hypothetical protein [Gemmataceae bacterium]